MKLNFSKKITALLISGFLALPVTTHASFIAGALEPTQWLNNFELLGVNLETGFSAAVDALIEQKEFSLDPIANELAVSVISQVQNDTIKWIATGFQGGGPAFVVNPEVYFKNLANKEIYKQIGGIENSGNLFANGVIGSVIKGVRGDRASIESQLQFTLGSSIKNSVCTDASLTSLATQQMGSGLTAGSQSSLSRSQQIENKKRELYLELCTGNPYKDTDLQKTLTSCFGSNFNCGGWDAWLSLTTNPNNTGYGAATKAQGLIAQRVSSVQDYASKELVNGLMPKKKCASTTTSVADPNDENSEPTTDCASWEVEIPAAAIVNQLFSAQGSTFDKAAASDEIGEVLSRILSTQLSSIFSNAFSGSTRGGGVNSSNASNFTVLPDGRISLTQPGGTITISATGTAPIDTTTANNLKESIQKTLNDLLSYKATLTRTLSLLNIYNQGLNNLETCYEELAVKNPSQANNQEVIEGKVYIADRRDQGKQPYEDNSNANSENNVSITALQDLISSIENDQSLENLTTVGTAYTELIRTSLMGISGKIGRAERQFTKLKGEIDTDTADKLNPKKAWCEDASRAQTTNGG